MVLCVDEKSQIKPLDGTQPMTPDPQGLQRLQRRQGQSLGRLVSDLLAAALKEQRLGGAEPPVFAWTARPMQARVDLADKQAVLDAMDEPTR